MFIRRPFPPQLEPLVVRIPLPPPSMEVVGAASAVVGLAIPVFETAKKIRDRIKLVR